MWLDFAVLFFNVNSLISFSFLKSSSFEIDSGLAEFKCVATSLLHQTPGRWYLAKNAKLLKTITKTLKTTTNARIRCQHLVIAKFCDLNFVSIFSGQSVLKSSSVQRIFNSLGVVSFDNQNNGVLSSDISTLGWRICRRLKFTEPVALIDLLQVCNAVKSNSLVTQFDWC